jgi:prevent-host-death family protein
MTMNETRIGAADFKANCLKIIDQIGKDKQPVTITKRGNPVARLSPIDDSKAKGSIIGAMKRSVLRFDDPFAPAADSSDWNAVR